MSPSVVRMTMVADASVGFAGSEIDSETTVSSDKSPKDSRAIACAVSDARARISAEVRGAFRPRAHQGGPPKA